MSIKQYLLDKELKDYKHKLKPVKFDRHLIPRLFQKFNSYGMTENWYCCHGEKEVCWQELVEEGVWDLKLHEVKDCIEENISYMKKYLYNQRKYGKRLYIYEDEERCGIFIYGRDLLQQDYSIWFTK